MATFLIDAENSIMAHATKQEAGEGDSFSSQQELASLVANWQADRLIEVWNGIPGLTPVKKFTGPRNGPISAVTFRPLLYWHVDSGCIPVRSRPGFHFTAQCVLFCGCPII